MIAKLEAPQQYDFGQNLSPVESEQIREAIQNKIF
jgi:hypothetical protein